MKVEYTVTISETKRSVYAFTAEEGMSDEDILHFISGGDIPPNDVEDGIDTYVYDVVEDFIEEE